MYRCRSAFVPPPIPPLRQPIGLLLRKLYASRDLMLRSHTVRVLLQYRTLKVGLSSGRLWRLSYILVVEISACPSHSCTLAMSALFASALVAAVARMECTQMPGTASSRPTSRA